MDCCIKDFCYLVAKNESSPIGLLRGNMNNEQNRIAIDVLTCSAAELLQGQIKVKGNAQLSLAQFTIPEYQRPYCWQEQQLEQLLTDIRTHNEHTPELPYYLGSLILHHDGERLNIIDGQQRITTMAMIAHTLGHVGGIPLLFESPQSQQQIKHNFAWLQQRVSALATIIDVNRLVFTLVITGSEDDAYLFFETQNTGGVRLGGPDIIKAHHLRAVSKPYQLHFAKVWESLGKLDDMVLALLKGRFWQVLNHRTLPTHQQTKLLRDAIVSEFAQQTGSGTGPDAAYGRFRREHHVGGESHVYSAQQGYELRQPLNAGVNTIHYLATFQSLHSKYWCKPDLPHLIGYQDFISWLKKQEGCGYLQGLYEACLLTYISQFGESQLEVAAKKLFRVVYSRRVRNQKAVRELTVPAFVREHPVLDWIAMSYTPEQCFQRFDEFSLVVESSNLETNSTKKRFMDSVVQHFNLTIESGNYAKQFASALNTAITEVQSCARL
jgi:hypothetical protein